MHLYPLTCDQIDVVRYCKNAPASLFNLAVYIEIDNNINEDLFYEAVKVTVERLPYSRCRLHKMTDDSINQYITDLNEQDIPGWKDFSNWSDNKINKQLSKWASTAFPNKLMDVQLFHVELLKLNNGKHGVFFCGHHIIMDIYAVVFFLTYLDKVYYALDTKTELPRLGGDPEKAANERFDYFKSEKYKKDYEWWLNNCSDEPKFTTLNGIGAREFIKGKRCGRQRNIFQLKAKEKSYTLSPELESLINSSCLKMNMSGSMAYALALRTFLAEVCKTDEASIQYTISFRTTLDQKSSGSSRASLIGPHTKIPFDMSFEDALKEMNKINKNCLKHIEMPASYLVANKYGLKKNEIYQSVVFSYVKYLDYDKIHLNIKARKIDSGISLKPVYILAMPLERNQPISLIYQYSVGYYKEEVIDRCQKFLEKFLENGFKNPDKTIGELAKISIQ